MGMLSAGSFKSFSAEIKMLKRCCLIDLKRNHLVNCQMHQTQISGTSNEEGGSKCCSRLSFRPLERINAL
jgi:hypothetical protein